MSAIRLGLRAVERPPSTHHRRRPFRYPLPESGHYLTAVFGIVDRKWAHFVGMSSAGSLGMESERYHIGSPRSTPSSQSASHIVP
jgi:hypothetical protein